MLTEYLMKLTVVGGSEWVLILLILLSFVSVALIVERALFLRSRVRRLDSLDRTLTPLILRGDAAGIRQAASQAEEPIILAAVEGLSERKRDREALEKLVQSAVQRERLVLEKRLTFLGTLGNNAPFIGLLGTVLGIIRAFRDLSLDTQGNSGVVMAGISEALVATAVGLFVALPAVLAFNVFMKKVDRLLSLSEALAQGILASVPASAAEAGPAASTGTGRRSETKADTAAASKEG